MRSPSDKTGTATDIDTRTLFITRFEDATAQTMSGGEHSLPSWCKHILDTDASAKDETPWLKLAQFGNKRSAKNCLRNDDNVTEISGIEVDYDGEVVSFDDAIETMRNANVRCLLYTSASHQPEAPRWRVLVPLSKNYPPTSRASMVGRVNGLFNGILAPESFVLSTSYHYGSVNHNPHHQAVVLDGGFLDLDDYLYAGSIDKNGHRNGHKDFEQAKAKPGRSGEPGNAFSAYNPYPADRDEIIAALAVIDPDCGWVRWYKIACAIWFELGDDGEDVFHNFSARSAKYKKAECEKKWSESVGNSLHTAGTIFYLATLASPDWRDEFKSAPDETDLEADQTHKSSPSGPKKSKGDNGVELTDFYAFMPTHQYIFTPTREMWPASSVNSRLPPVPVLKKDGTPARGANGNPKYTKPNLWLDAKRPVEQMTWAPGEPLVIADRLISEGGWIVHNGIATFNLYRAPTIKPGEASKATRWVDLVHKVYPDDADHILDFFAHRVQKPQEKINHGIVLGGDPGIGKDSLVEGLKEAVGPWNCKEASPQDVMGSYNDFMRSVVLRISEARDLGDVNRFAFHEHSKTLLATPPDVVRVNAKYIPQHYVLNRCGVIFTTNNKTDCLYLPADDRRHYVAWSDLKREHFADGYWLEFYDWYQNQDGFEHVAAFLAERDISGFDAKAPPKKTAAFWAIVDAGVPTEQSELADVIDEIAAGSALTKKPARNVDAITLAIINDSAVGQFFEWLQDRKNRRSMSRRFEKCGYTPVRNPDANDGLWVIKRKRQVIYARSVLPAREQYSAAKALVKAGDS